MNSVIVNCIMEMDNVTDYLTCQIMSCVTIHSYADTHIFHHVKRLLYDGNTVNSIVKWLTCSLNWSRKQL